MRSIYIYIYSRLIEPGFAAAWDQRLVTSVNIVLVMFVRLPLFRLFWLQLNLTRFSRCLILSRLSFDISSQLAWSILFNQRSPYFLCVSSLSPLRFFFPNALMPLIRQECVSCFRPLDTCHSQTAYLTLGSLSSLLAVCFVEPLPRICLSEPMI